jgi:Anaphase-promoting complex, cyclosome, subunit 3
MKTETDWQLAIDCIPWRLAVVLVQSNKHLLATCYMRCGQHYRAAAALQGTTAPECRYLLALCYMKLPGKLNDAAAALMPGRDPSQVWTAD